MKYYTSIKPLCWRLNDMGIMNQIWCLCPQKDTRTKTSIRKLSDKRNSEK